MVPADADCPQPPKGRAVGFGLPPFVEEDGAHGSNAFGRVSNVTVDGYLSEGLTAIGAFGSLPANVTFAGNTVNSGTPVMPTEQMGINVAFGAVGRVTDNTVTGALCTMPGCGADPITEFQSAGINAGGAMPGTIITGNHVSNADIGIYQLASRTAAGSPTTRSTTTGTSASPSRTETALPTPTRSPAARSASASSRTPWTRRACSVAT